MAKRRQTDASSGRTSAAARQDIEARIRAKVYKTLMQQGLSEAAADEAAFHLTDWFADLQDLNGLFGSARWNPSHAWEVLVGFVVHAPAHLAAAHRILLDDPVADVFELGAVKGSGRAKREPGGPYSERAAGRGRSKRTSSGAAAKRG